MTEEQIIRIGEAIMVLADSLTEPDYEVTAIDVLGLLDGQVIAAHECRDVMKYLT